MFGLFKKDPIKKLQKQYKELLEASFKLSTTDRKASDLKRAEAEEVLNKIEKLFLLTTVAK
jgi:phage-related tail protein